jgi:hypothetical protein
MYLIKTKLLVIVFLIPVWVLGQTLNDGIMMKKGSLCSGISLQQERFSDYWEGTLLRNSVGQGPGMGTVTGSTVGAMFNYGIFDRLNVIGSVPFVSMRASEGTLGGLSGFQDVTLGIKYKAWKGKDFGFIVEVGGSVPMSNYLNAYPLSIGTQSKTAFLKGLFHYLSDDAWTAAAYASYTLRGNIKIEANSYYTDHYIFSNEVAMPDVLMYGVRAGKYSYRWQAELIFDRMSTSGGFDIARQQGMFPSNKQEVGRLGFYGSYRIEKLGDLQVALFGSYALSGRNVGQSTVLGMDFNYIFDFSKKEKEEVKK